MATSSDRDARDKKDGKNVLPVIGEVGSEGGSYSDATVQVATFNEDVGKTADASEPGKVTSGKDDVLRYPDEKSD